MKKTLLITFILSVLCLSMAISLHAQSSATLNADQNNYIVTYGGGMGKNSFLKFDISSIPGGATIDSVIFRCYVFQYQTTWDGDVEFMRYDNQTWLETDSTQDMWNTLLLTDTVNQLSGFGDTIGFFNSVDLSSLFIPDYLAANTYFSLCIKDPDDPTIAPAMPAATFTNPDSLLLGNIFNDQIGFRPRLYANPNQRPLLLVYYTPPTSVEEPNSYKTSVRVQPNPHQGNFNVVINQLAEESTLEFMNVAGEVIKTIRVTSDDDQQIISVDISNVADGIYIMKLQNPHQTIVQKTIKY